MKEKKRERILKILRFLEENPNTYLSEIARALGLHPEVVRRILKELDQFIIARSVADSIGDLNLPNLPVMIRLKEGVTAEGVLKFLEIKEKIDKARM